MMKTTFLVLCAVLGFSLSLFGETYNSPQSTALSKFAMLANSCIKNGTIEGNADLTEIERIIASEFGTGYLALCRPLLDGILEINQAPQSGDPTTFRVLGYSQLIQPARSKYSMESSTVPDGRYVIYWSRNVIFGQFVDLDKFQTLMKSQNLDESQVKRFVFPELQEQNGSLSLVVRDDAPPSLPKNGRSLAGVVPDRSSNLESSRNPSQTTWNPMYGSLMIVGGLIVSTLIALWIKSSRRAS